MDYGSSANNDSLVYAQWEAIHNPAIIGKVFQSDEDGAASNSNLVELILNDVRKGIFDKAPFIDLSKYPIGLHLNRNLILEGKTYEVSVLVSRKRIVNPDIYDIVDDDWEFARSGDFKKIVFTDDENGSYPKALEITFPSDQETDLKNYIFGIQFPCSVCGRELTLNLEKLKKIFAGNDNISQDDVKYFNNALKVGGFNTCRMHAHVFSQIIIESKNFSDFEEDYHYRLTTILSKFNNQSNDCYKTLFSQNLWAENKHLDYIGTNNCTHLFKNVESYSDKSKLYKGVGEKSYFGKSKITGNGMTIKIPDSFSKDESGGYIKADAITTAKALENGKRLFNLIYGNINGNTNSGDGWNYRGRGAIQVTGRSNYKNASDRCNTLFSKSFDWEKTPDQLKDNKEAIIYSVVGWFRNNIVPISDLDGMSSSAVTYKVNSAGDKKDDRETQYKKLIDDDGLYKCK